MRTTHTLVSFISSKSSVLYQENSLELKKKLSPIYSTNKAWNLNEEDNRKTKYETRKEKKKAFGFDAKSQQKLWCKKPERNKREPLHKIVGSSVYQEKCRYIHYLDSPQWESWCITHTHIQFEESTWRMPQLTKPKLSDCWNSNY